MELSTIGIEKNAGYIVPIYIDNNERFAPEVGLNERFCFVLVKKGTAIINFNENQVLLIAPCVLCLNEKDVKFLVQENNLEARSVYFHPCAINSAFMFENIRDEKFFSGTVRSDLEWFFPFIIRNAEYKGMLNIGPGTAQRISQLIDTLHGQLNGQNDFFWPCRSRSYFLELLLLIYRLYLEPETSKDFVVADADPDIQQIIMHLNLNYREKITLEDLSSTFHINRTTLNEKFVKATGSTIKKYITNLRVNLACGILRDTSLPIEEIMERVGFNDITNFGKMMRKYTGCSPSEYRNKYCWMR